MIRSLSLAFMLSTAVMICGASYAGDDSSTIPTSRVLQGKAISPVKLNLTGKNPTEVYLGSYLVNAVGDCSGCHSFPQYLAKGGPGTNPRADDPYLGTPSTQGVSKQLVANFNNSHYLAGGQCFGPYMARNLTPDPSEKGLPEGLTQAEFVKALRTGEDIQCEKFPKNPICALGPPKPVLLQVMPWPTYHSMITSDLNAIYTYLTAIPTATACNTVVDGCPGFSGRAKNSKTYVYKITTDCPNSALVPQ
jgi:hypothetical protein